MALSYLMLESGDVLLREDGGFLLTEDSGPEERLGSSDITIDAVVADASAALTVRGLVDGSLGALLLAAAGALPGGGAAIVTISPIAVVSSASLGLSGATEKTLGPITLDASGDITVEAGTGSLSLNLAPVTVFAGGEIDLSGVSNIVIAAIWLSANGAHGAMATGALSATLSTIDVAATGSLGAAVDDGEPVTLSEVRRALRIDHDDEDDLIRELIVSAREAVEHMTSLTVVRRAVTKGFDGFSDYMPLWAWPIVVEDGATVSFVDTSGMEQALAGVRLLAHRRPARIAPAVGEHWPAAEAVSVTVTAGYPTRDAVPRALRRAMLMLIGHWYANREAVVIGSVASKLDLAVEELVGPFRIELA